MVDTATAITVSKYNHTLVDIKSTCRKEVTPMTGAQMRYYNLNAGAKANFALKVRLALSIIRNYENGNSKNYSHSEYMECSKFIQDLEP